MKVIGIIAIILAAAVAIYLFTAQKSIQDIDVAMLMEKMENEDDLIIIDLRTQSEIDASGLIGDAIHIDFMEDSFYDEVAKLDKNKPYVLYCASGGRSSRALTYFQEEGFDEAYNLLGGYNAWESR